MRIIHFIQVVGKMETELVSGKFIIQMVILILGNGEIMNLMEKGLIFLNLLMLPMKVNG